MQAAMQLLYFHLAGLSGCDQGGQDTLAVLGCGACCCYLWRSSCQIYSQVRCFYA